jgi:hypothetical protein
VTDREKSRSITMNIIDQIKPFLGENANIAELEAKLNEMVKVTPDKLKELMSLPENKPVFDSIVGKSISTHIEKEKASRAEWEKTRSAELYDEAVKKIEDESKKPEWQIKMDAIQAELDKEKNEKRETILKNTLLEIVEKDKLPIANVNPFVRYGEDAETEMRNFAQTHLGLIDELVKKQVAEKYGGGKMPGEKPPIDDKPVSAQDHIAGIFNQ